MCGTSAPGALAGVNPRQGGSMLLFENVVWKGSAGGALLNGSKARLSGARRALTQQVSRTQHLPSVGKFLSSHLRSSASRGNKKISRNTLFTVMRHCMAKATITPAGPVSHVCFAAPNLYGR